MKIAIFGSGYVGLVAGTCLCSAGHEVTMIDIDATKLKQIEQGKVPFYEPSLGEMLVEANASGRFHVSSDPAMVRDCRIVVNAVGTPKMDDSGETNLTYVHNMIDSVIPHLNTLTLIVNKSTVPVGTAKAIQKSIDEKIPQKAIQVVSNPEFLKEGNAVQDFLHPDRIIIGANCQSAFEVMKELYSSFSSNQPRIIEMDSNSAEFTKYTANCILATKISFMNEMAHLADTMGVDIDQVRIGIGSDPRIGHSFIYPGCGFGGSCFPKDIDSLLYSAQQQKLPMELLSAVKKVNQQQKNYLFNTVQEHYRGKVSKKIVAVWGLSFKPQTDDVREAPSLELVSSLLAAGATVHGYDPVASTNFTKQINTVKNKEHFKIFSDKYSCVENANALIVCTEWQEFKIIDTALLLDTMNGTLVLDGRNIYSPHAMHEAGFNYISVGRNTNKTSSTSSTSKT